MAYGKKTLKEKFNSAARKFLLWTGLLAAGSAPFAYEYGTVKEQTVKVTGYKNNGDDTYTFYTDKGTFNAERSRLHLQSKEDAGHFYSMINTGDTYDIKTYGWHLAGSWQPNIFEATPVSAEELQKRQDNLGKKDVKDSKTTANTTQPVANSNAAALSGQMVTTNVIVNGYNVQITIPVEAAGKVTINGVAPVVQTNNVTQPVTVPNTPVNNSANTPAPQ